MAVHHYAGARAGRPVLLLAVAGAGFAALRLTGGPRMLGFASGPPAGLGLRAGAASGGRGCRDSRVQSRYQVTLSTPDGTQTFECPPDAYILDRAQDMGYELPYSCRVGCCSSCAGKVLSGVVDQSEQAFLDEDQVNAGFCLTCVSKATSDVTIKTNCEEEINLGIAPEATVPVRARQATKTHASSAVFRQQFTETSEDLINQQIQLELFASHSYQTMGAYFDRTDVALPGFKEWSMEQSREEREHAEKFIQHLNLRGGSYEPRPIPQPATATFSSALEAMEYALKMEMSMNRQLLRLHKVAGDGADPQLRDFLETEFLQEQVKSINYIARVVRKLTRTGPGLGEYMVDKEMA